MNFYCKQSITFNHINVDEMNILCQQCAALRFTKEPLNCYQNGKVSLPNLQEYRAELRQLCLTAMIMKEYILSCTFKSTTLHFHLLPLERISRFQQDEFLSTSDYKSSLPSCTKTTRKESMDNFILQTSIKLSVKQLKIAIVCSQYLKLSLLICKIIHMQQRIKI